MADGANEHVRIFDRKTMTELYNFGYGGRQPGQFLGVHSIAVDSKGNIYTTETYTGKRLQKFVFKGLGAVPKSSKVPAWPGSRATEQSRELRVKSSAGLTQLAARAGSGTPRAGPFVCTDRKPTP